MLPASKDEKTRGTDRAGELPVLETGALPQRAIETGPLGSNQARLVDSHPEVQYARVSQREEHEELQLHL